MTPDTSDTTITWWVNGQSQVRHATQGGPTALCGQPLHRNAWLYSGGAPISARACRKCAARVGSTDA